MDALMQEVDPTKALQLRVNQAVQTAIDLLARVAAGEHAFGDDSQLRACVALARLAPRLLRPGRDDARFQLRDLSHPDNSHVETLRLLDELERTEASASSDDLQRDEIQQEKR